MKYKETVYETSVKEIEITNINSIDMMMLDTIYSKAKELFE